MQLAFPRGKYVEKIVRDAQGRLVRATFCVYECEGRIKARLVDAIFIEENLQLSGETLKLAVFAKNLNTEYKKVLNKRVSSPYFSLNQLYFLGSKPRAPSRK